MANACVDSNDFTKDPGGRLQLNPATAQNADATFAHVLNGVDGTYELINELPAVVVPRNGKYLVLWDIHGNVVLPGPNLGVPLNGRTMGALAINGVFQPGTETQIVSINEGATTVDFPALGQEGTGSGSRVFDLTAGQQLRIMGAQEGNGSNTSTILSNDDGRCRITIVRLGV